jgi:tRNA threonylcarbamoyladenosine biosynthesis protein TsaE
VGREIARFLDKGDIVALYGLLGAGKTQLVRGICDGLGVDPELVTSPTFTLLAEHRGRECSVYHFDAYRLDTTDAFMDLGYEEYFFGDGVTIVEWADRVESLLPADALRILLSHKGSDARIIEWVSRP